MRIWPASSPRWWTRSTPRFREGRPCRTSPPALDGEQPVELKAAAQELPSQAGIDSSNWNWKAARRYVRRRFGLALSRGGCLNYPRRLGFVLKRFKKR